MGEAFNTAAIAAKLTGIEMAFWWFGRKSAPEQTRSLAPAWLSRGGDDEGFAVGYSAQFEEIYRRNPVGQRAVRKTDPLRARRQRVAIAKLRTAGGSNSGRPCRARPTDRANAAPKRRTSPLLVQLERGRAHIVKLSL